MFKLSPLPLIIPRRLQMDSFFISPGLRWARNFPGGLQIVPGIAFPIGTGPSRGDRAVLFYVSFEHPLRRASK